MALNMGEKKLPRISKIQKEKLVDYMSSNLEFARGQLGGINPNDSKEKWEALRITLNSLGGRDKSVEQWKKCWIDLKSAVKKQVNSRRSFIHKTGDGSSKDAPRELNSFEEQILSIMTVDAVDGDSVTPESCAETLDESSMSIEILDDEEIFQQPKEIKIKATSKESPISTSSKFKEALQESRHMYAELMSKITKIEKQNEEILERLSKIEQKLN